MASYQMEPPKEFNFAQPEGWSQWIKRFQRFRSASGLQSKSEETQVNTFIYSMGAEADDILSSFALTEDERKEYKTVVDRFETYFIKKRNVIYERARFNQRRQNEGEPVDAYITDLHKLSEHCQYGTLREEMIRDRIVVGILDTSLSEKLQLDSTLTLEKATTEVRQREMVRKQQSTVRKTEESVQMDTVGLRQCPDTRRQSSTRKSHFQVRQPTATNRRGCYWCGQTHDRGKEHCPARFIRCHSCNKVGHFQSVCKSSSKRVETVQDSGDEFELKETIFMGSIEVDTVNSTYNDKPWMAKVLVNGITVHFKLDTGADVTAISPEIRDQLADKISLQKSETLLKGPGQELLSVKGKFNAILTWNQKAVGQDIYVIDKLRTPLIGRKAIDALGMVTRIEIVEHRQSAKQPNTSYHYFRRFPSLFQGLGKMTEEYQIQLYPDAIPFSISAPRRIPYPLRHKVQEELVRMERSGVISKVQEPTPWCAGIVVVPKANEQVRICVDLTKLNVSVCRERYQLPSVEESLSKLAEAKVFTKLDANSGFWQIPLHPSRLLTTFLTPFGRYCFNRMPFGITSAPEHFQSRISKILGDSPGVICQMDDILVFGSCQEEHDQRLQWVLQRLQNAHVTLNADKCQFSQSSITFLGQVIGPTGIQLDPARIHAIREMTAPKNVGDLRRLLGMLNHFNKFTPRLADICKPLRALLGKEIEWRWGYEQEEAFEAIKSELNTPATLGRYNPTEETVIAADASSFGLGAVIRQKQGDGMFKPIAYASRSLTATECRYAQIEKEALALTWACEKFNDYILGLKFCILTDHKPLISLLGTKSLDQLPARIQRFRMRLMKYHYDIEHVPGKDLVVADTLSRSPVSKPTVGDHIFGNQIYSHVSQIVQSLPASEHQLQNIKNSQNQDRDILKVKQYMVQSWPNHQLLSQELKCFQSVAEELTEQEGILLRQHQIVIPKPLRAEMLKRLHESHLGITKCRERARQSMWWPGMSKDIYDLIAKCDVCNINKTPHPEPLIPSTFPCLPWEKVGTDLFTWHKSDYLVVVDYYSRFVEVIKLRCTSSSSIVAQLATIFARHGVPQVVMSDNGPQYQSTEFQQFADVYGFHHVTSSPRYPQANGEVERAVKTVKASLDKCSDINLALLAYRTSPLRNGYSPAELLMSRKLRTTLPMISQLLQPIVPSRSVVQQREQQQQRSQARGFNSCHSCQPLVPLKEGDTVWIRDARKHGWVKRKAAYPRSYIVGTDTGLIRRNRRHLVHVHQAVPHQAFSRIPDDIPFPEQPVVQQNSVPNVHHSSTVTRSGRVSRPPDRWSPPLR